MAIGKVPPPYIPPQAPRPVQEEPSPIPPPRPAVSVNDAKLDLLMEHLAATQSMVYNMYVDMRRMEQNINSVIAYSNGGETLLSLVYNMSVRLMHMEENLADRITFAGNDTADRVLAGVAKLKTTF